MVSRSPPVEWVNLCLLWARAVVVASPVVAAPVERFSLRVVLWVLLMERPLVERPWVAGEGAARSALFLGDRRSARAVIRY